jgi:hypothetical protein
MGFIQIIEAHSPDVDALRAIDDEWRRATEGKRSLRRAIVASDRHDPNRYLILAFFDSYESAMANSALPETQEFAQKWAAAVDGPLTFHDLDVLDDRTD